MSIIINKDLRVAHVLSSSQVVLNAGSKNGISMYDEFIIYGLSDEEIIDPATGNSLGYLELYRGTGAVTYLQDTMCILNALSSSVIGRLELVTGDPAGKFNHPLVGDYAKPNAAKSQIKKKI